MLGTVFINGGVCLVLAAIASLFVEAKFTQKIDYAPLIALAGCLFLFIGGIIQIFGG